METYVTVCGNLVADPTRRATQGGVAVTGIRLASTPRRFDRVSNEWKDGTTLFINVSCWRVLGDNVVESLTKGDPVVVYGRLTLRSWTDKDGQARNTYEIDASVVGPDLSRGTCRVTRRGHAPAPDGWLDGAGGPGADTPPDPESVATDPGRSDDVTDDLAAAGAAAPA